MLHLVLALSAQSFVCPPIEEKLAVRQIGEQCGGTCNTYGECAEGLECHNERTTSPMSFAILMGATKKAGTCRGKTVEGRSLAGGMVGAPTAASIDDPDVLAATKFAVATMMQRSNSLTPSTLTRIKSVTTQVVAGTKYTLRLVMSDSSEHVLQIVDQPWMTPRYTMIADDLVTTP